MAPILDLNLLGTIRISSVKYWLWYSFLLTTFSSESLSSSNCFSSPKYWKYWIEESSFPKCWKHAGIRSSAYKGIGSSSYKWKWRDQRQSKAKNQKGPSHIKFLLWETQGRIIYCNSYQPNFNHRNGTLCIKCDVNALIWHTWYWWGRVGSSNLTR